MPDEQRHEGSWVWDGDSRRLQIELEPGSTITDLKGNWSPDGLGSLLDGFSRNRLLLALMGSEVAVNCALNLSDGREIQLVGAFLAPGNARGMILSGTGMAGSGGERDGPGPVLAPVFQPIVDLETLRPVGLEGLARWDTALDDVSTARRFENDGLASNMLIKAASALNDWRKAGAPESLFVHVNLTGRDLELPGLARLVEALIDGYGLPPRALRIELTEQAALRDAGAALETARALKAVGAGLILDDFGSGHSSFSWLADLPADGIKIDSDLIARSNEPRTAAILKAIAGLAHELDMTVTGEGVEHDWQVDALRAYNFDYVQGFALSRPMAASKVATYLVGD